MRFEPNLGLGTFHVRYSPWTKRTPFISSASTCRSVNVNSISTQLNYSHLYYICVRALECALFIIFMLVG